ncbi:MAG: acyl-ACP desaturase [Chloroflexi bacterium]|nr:acyl-ACP desaturase [Chloroflexota bacterium]
MTAPDPKTKAEIEDQRPAAPPGLLSHDERNRLIQRGVHGLYRWYLSVSQAKRNWNPDLAFDWRKLRQDHSADVHRVIEGFFAVEQYVPDYTELLIKMFRKEHGRSHFQIRWGAEEEKHADLWYNALLFMRQRSPEWVRDYMQHLRSTAWEMLYDDPIKSTAYVVIQERATQLNYLNTALLAEGKMAGFEDDADPVLAHAAKTIAVDEAAHYNFYLECLRLYLYYYPARTLEALHQVISDFAMPANRYIPDFQSFADALVKTCIYGPREYARDVLQMVLDNLGIESRRALDRGIKASRNIPDGDTGELRTSAFFTFFDYEVIEDAVKRLFTRVKGFEAKVGFDALDPTVFVPSGMGSD